MDRDLKIDLLFWATPHTFLTTKKALVDDNTGIGLLQLVITWYKIRHAGGQAHYHSRTETLIQRDLNQ